MKAELDKAIQDLFTGYAPEYVLAAVRNELQRRGGLQPGNGLSLAAVSVNHALFAVCSCIPGYRAELDALRDDKCTRPPMSFEPRW